jgi:mRNA interferase MazF
VAVAVTSNTALARAPGNVLLSRRASGLRKESVANVSQVVTLDRSLLTTRVRRVPKGVLASVEAGLRLVLGL